MDNNNDNNHLSAILLDIAWKQLPNTAAKRNRKKYSLELQQLISKLIEKIEFGSTCLNIEGKYIESLQKSIQWAQEHKLITLIRKNNFKLNIGDIKHINNTKNITSPFVLLEDTNKINYIFTLNKLWNLELYIAQSLYYLQNTNLLNINSKKDDNHLNLLDNLDIIFNNRLGVITGGPGTGKTTLLVNSINNIEYIHKNSKFQNQNFEVNLLAPTGKATFRIKELIPKLKENTKKFVARIATLEKFNNEIKHLLQISDAELSCYRLSRHEIDERNKFRYIFIDESSMINMKSLIDFFNLLFAQDNFALILIGDSRQLSSIEEGKFFSVIAKSMTSLVINLTKNYRSNVDIFNIYNLIFSDLNAFFNTVKQKQFQIAKDILTNTNIDTFLQFKEKLKTINILDLDNSSEDINLNKIVEAILNYFYSYIIDSPTPHDALKKINEFKFITPYNKITNKINAILDKKHGNNFYHGQLILINENNYNLELYNGDIGLLWKQDETFWLYFNKNIDNKNISARGENCQENYYKIQAKELQINQINYQSAWAITIHKSQGSEYETVFLLMQDTLNFNSATQNSTNIEHLISKELFYTAISRSKERFILSAKLDSLHKLLELNHNLQDRESNLEFALSILNMQNNN